MSRRAKNCLIPDASGPDIPAGIEQGRARARSAVADTVVVRRQSALASYAILDTEAEAEFDEIVQAASAACAMPVSLISFFSDDRHWIKAGIGLHASEIPLSSSICALTIEQRDVLVIPDATLDPRTAANHLVTGPHHLRFYAGVPLETGDGITLGALCVADTKPNQLNASQLLILRTLARQTMAVLELRRTIRSDRRHRAIIESAIDFGIIALDLSGHITSWNTGAERIFGWSETEMRGKPAHIIFTEQDVKDGVPDQEMKTALQQGRGSDERWHLKKDRSLFWASGELMPLTDADGTLEGFIKILRDRTEQRNTAARHEADAEFMHSVLASSADCIKVLDLDTRLTFMNEGGLKVMEISDFNDVKGCPWPDFWVGQGNLDAVAALDAARAGGVGHFQGAANTFRGTPKWWDVQVTAIRGADGAPSKLLAVSRDISGQKAVESQLAASEARWRGLFKGMQEGFFLGELIRDTDGRATDCRFLEINPAFARQSGLPADSIGRTIRDLVPDIDQSLIDSYAHVVDSGQPIALEIDVHALNRSFDIRVSKEQDDRFSCLFLDCTDRKKADARRTATTELGDYLRDAATVLEMTTKAAEIVGKTLNGSRAGYGELDATCENVSILWDAVVPGEVSIVGNHRFSDFGAVAPYIEQGDPVIVSDVTTDTRTVGHLGIYTGINLRAMLNVPVQEHGRSVGLIFVHSPVARVWTPDEVAFARNVADRVQVGIARLRADEQQAILNRELSHRMKNTLAIVQAIATQTLRNASDLAGASDTLSARLVALGRAHDLLLTGESESADMRAIIEGALELHDDRQSGRFTLEGPDLRVGEAAALSLALMIHELATNAAKYGALSRPQGRVRIGWAISGQAGEETVQLRWQESGGPPVTPPTRKGFGSRLIERGLSGAVGGEVVTDYRPEGLTCTLTAPLAGFTVSPSTSAC